MKALTGILTAAFLSTPPFAAFATDEQEIRYMETDDAKYLLKLQKSDHGTLMHITPVFEGDEKLISEFPADCPECGSGCLAPPLVRWSPGSSNLGMTGGVLNLTVERPAGCIRIDGNDVASDSVVHLWVANRRGIPFLVEVHESGDLLLKRSVFPEEGWAEQLAPSGSRRYTLSVSAETDQAEGLPTYAGFAIYRYENGEEAAMSLFLINLGAGQ